MGRAITGAGRLAEQERHLGRRPTRPLLNYEWDCKGVRRAHDKRDSEPSVGALSRQTRDRRGNSIRTRREGSLLATSQDKSQTFTGLVHRQPAWLKRDPFLLRESPVWAITARRGELNWADDVGGNTTNNRKS
jgi:hypothetical protein